MEGSRPIHWPDQSMHVREVRIKGIAGHRIHPRFCHPLHHRLLLVRSHMDEKQKEQEETKILQLQLGSSSSSPSLPSTGNVLLGVADLENWTPSKPLPSSSNSGFSLEERLANLFVPVSSLPSDCPWRDKLWRTVLDPSCQDQLGQARYPAVGIRKRCKWFSKKSNFYLWRGGSSCGDAEGETRKNRWKDAASRQNGNCFGAESHQILRQEEIRKRSSEAN